MGKTTSFFVSRFLNKYVSTPLRTNLALSISTFIIWGNIKPQHEPLVLMVFLRMGWYSNFMCHSATLENYEGNFLKTFNSTLMDYIKCALCIFSIEIVKEHKNHHELASSYKQASHVQKTPRTSIMSQRRAKSFFACKTHTLVKQNEQLGLFNSF